MLGMVMTLPPLLQVLDGGAVVIRGIPKGGPPPERTLALTNINAPRLARRPNAALPEGGEDEPLAWEAREFLRKMVVGKTVLGCVVHSTATRWSLLLLLLLLLLLTRPLYLGSMACSCSGTTRPRAWTWP